MPGNEVPLCPQRGFVIRSFGHRLPLQVRKVGHEFQFKGDMVREPIRGSIRREIKVLIEAHDFLQRPHAILRIVSAVQWAGRATHADFVKGDELHLVTIVIHSQGVYSNG